MVLVVKNLPANTGDIRGVGSIPGSGRFPRGVHGNPLQYSCWRIPWTEESGRLPFIRSQRVWHDWSDFACNYTSTGSDSRIQGLHFGPTRWPLMWLTPRWHPQFSLRGNKLDSWKGPYLPVSFGSPGLSSTLLGGLAGLLCSFWIFGHHLILLAQQPCQLQLFISLYPSLPRIMWLFSHKIGWGLGFLNLLTSEELCWPDCFRSSNFTEDLSESKKVYAAQYWNMSSIWKMNLKLRSLSSYSFSYWDLKPLKFSSIHGFIV